MLFDDPDQVIADLSPADGVVAEVKALLGPPVGKNAFIDIVRAAGRPSPDGKAWTAAKVTESVDRLVRKRVLGPDDAIAPALSQPLTLRVLARPDGAALVAAVRKAAPKSHLERQGYRHWKGPPPHLDADLARSVRLAVLANDGDAVEKLIHMAQTSMGQDGVGMAVAPWLLHGCPTDLAFLNALSPGLRDRVTSAVVEFLIDQGVIDDDGAALIEALRSQSWDWSAAPLLDRALMRLDLLGERPESARVRAARLRASDPGAALGCEAALTFLTDPAKDSLPLFRDALKQHRKAVGRRKTALADEFGVFHVLALLAAGETTLTNEMPVVEDIGVSLRSPIDWTVCGLVELAVGQEANAKAWADRLVDLPTEQRGVEGPLVAGLIGVAIAIINGGRATVREGEDRKAVARWGAQAPLAVRMLCQVHLRSSRNPDPWRTALDALGSTYQRQFLDIVTVRPAWERALDKLQLFLVPPETGKIEPASKGKRLVFLFDPASAEITPIEQMAKRDGWTAGRPVSLKRLYKRDPKLDYFTPEDLKVLNTIRHHHDYYDDRFEFDEVRGPLALVGHPRVFNAIDPGRQVEVIAYPAELVVREDGDNLHISLSHVAASPQAFVEMETPTRWRVIEATKALVDLAAILGPKGLTAPKAARERVIALVKADNPRLPVRSELAGVDTQVAIGDSRPVLQITPDDGAFVIRALVRPLGDGGSTYIPGVGAASVLAPVGGAHIRINRDLAAEKSGLEAVAKACPALEAWRESDHGWRIESLDAALEALQQLHAIEGALHLEWPQGAAVRPTRNVGARAVSLNISSGRDWFDVKGQVRVDEDLVLDMADVLARLGAARGRFVALDDGRYLALTEDLKRRLEAFAAATETAKSGRRIGVAGAGVVDDLVSVAGAVKTDQRWTEVAAKFAAAQTYQPQIPPSLAADLRDYQRQGFEWMARLSQLGLGACLADDMGLGKTLQTLALLLSEAKKGPSLVVAPTSVCHNWALEAARFAPGLRVHMLGAAPDRGALVESLGRGDVLVASYGLLHTEADLLASCRFAAAVFDEAQNLKNAETRRAQASKRIDADFRLALSGTPVENRLDELWSLYDTVLPGLLGSRESFQRRFSGPIERGQAGHARQALKALVRPYFLRRTKAAVLTELPARTEIVLEIEPGEEERAFYEALRRKALETLAAPAPVGGQKQVRILAEITRLRRAACNPALVDPTVQLDSAKLHALLELAAELIENQHRALVFSQFTGHLDLVEAALTKAGFRLLRLDGSTSTKERAKRVEAFQAGEGELFLISLKAGGVGLNLTGADYVIHLDPWWNPAVEDQATDRAHRIGQTRPVTVYRLVLKNSIEQQILALHDSKRALSADFLDGAEGAAALTEEELMALIRG